MHTKLTIGTLTFENSLIQGPLAGYSCAPFRQLFSLYRSPAYCVSEMLSAHDVVSGHKPQDRYLYRGSDENVLCYQIAGTEPELMAKAASKLEGLGADLIDINCGCPKAKIRKKGAGSALLSQPETLLSIVQAVRASITCPLTVKLRIQGNEQDVILARRLAETGVDALIVHGRKWDENYDTPCDLNQIANIKRAINIPVIANGDVKNASSLTRMVNQTGCDAVMISRAGTGKPWLYHSLLNQVALNIESSTVKALFLWHIENLAMLENEYPAVLQSRSLFAYYFKDRLHEFDLKQYYRFTHIQQIKKWLNL